MLKDDKVDVNKPFADVQFLLDYMAEHGLSRIDLAKKIGVRNVTVYHATHNFTNCYSLGFSYQFVKNVKKILTPKERRAFDKAVKIGWVERNIINNYLKDKDFIKYADITINERVKKRWWKIENKENKENSESDKSVGVKSEPVKRYIENLSPHVTFDNRRGRNSNR